MGFLLRALLALLAGILLARVLRRSFGPPPGTPRSGQGKGLDPSREVRASWSEVDEEGRPRRP